MAGITRLKLTNVTKSTLVLCIGSAKTEAGQPPQLPIQVEIPALNITSPVIIEGDLAEMLQKDSAFKMHTDAGHIVVNRDAKMGEEKRSTSEPVAPADLVEKITPGATTPVGNLQHGVTVKSVEIQ
jgi:hypothetical protein